MPGGVHETGKAGGTAKMSEQENPSLPKPRGWEGAHLDGLKDNEKRELGEFMPNDLHLVFNRIITIINGPVMR